MDGDGDDRARFRPGDPPVEEQDDFADGGPLPAAAVASREGDRIEQGTTHCREGVRSRVRGVGKASEAPRQLLQRVIYSR